MSVHHNRCAVVRISRVKPFSGVVILAPSLDSYEQSASYDSSRHDVGTRDARGEGLWNSDEEGREYLHASGLAAASIAAYVSPPPSLLLDVVAVFNAFSPVPHSTPSAKRSFFSCSIRCP